MQNFVLYENTNIGWRQGLIEEENFVCFKAPNSLVKIKDVDIFILWTMNIIFGSFYLLVHLYRDFFLQIQYDVFCNMKYFLCNQKTLREITLFGLLPKDTVCLSVKFNIYWQTCLIEQHWVDFVMELVDNCRR